jgi:transcriptional regulator with XRE-family HTH domain
MYFQTLQGRLLDSIRKRVQNGEITERRLAGMSGISQPHMHNLLKGARALSPAIADRIMRTLDISVLDLLVPEDGKPAVSTHRIVLPRATHAWPLQSVQD